MNVSCLPLASTKSCSLPEVWLDLTCVGPGLGFRGFRLQGLGILAGPFWGWAAGSEWIGGVSSLIYRTGSRLKTLVRNQMENVDEHQNRFPLVK
jgi:hypothetical protein